MKTTLHRHRPVLKPSRSSEKRRWPRLECARSLMIHPVRRGQIEDGIPTQSEDFSTMGLALLHPAPMKAGEQFLVPLTTRSGAELPLLYSVVYCRPGLRGLYRIGAELVSIFNLEKFARLRHPEQSFTQYICAVVGEQEQSL